MSKAEWQTKIAISIVDSTQAQAFFSLVSVLLLRFLSEFDI